MSYIKPIVLQNTDLTEAGNARLKELFTVVQHNELDKYREQIKGIVTIGGCKVSAALIDALPSLEVIATRSVGFDHIDLQAASKRGIVISNTPGVLSDCVADFAFGALIAISRELIQAERFLRTGQWLLGRFPLTTKVSGKRLGIVGMGRIGQAVAKRANGFSMETRYFSRSKNTQCSEVFEPSLIELAKWADYLVLCIPGGEATRNIISYDVLEALGEKSYLINVARGSVVDEVALVQALNQKKIAGAALDVYVNEPKVSQELLDSDRLLLLPHIASNTEETFAEMESLVFDNLLNYFSKGSLLTPVSQN